MPATGTQKFADSHQYPVNANRAHGAIEQSRTLFHGATGLVGTTMSRVPMVATRVSTGLYRFQHPPSVNLGIIAAHVEGPTGTYYGAHVRGPRFGVTGTFDVTVTRPELAAISGGSAPVMPVNPATGAALVITYFDAPRDLPVPPFKAPKLSY